MGLQKERQKSLSRTDEATALYSLVSHFRLIFWSFYDHNKLLILYSACYCLLHYYSSLKQNLAITHSVIGSKFSCHFFNQSEVKPKQIVARACAFSRALCRLRVITGTSRFDWFTGLSPSFLIGQSNYSGFAFTTLI